MKSQELDILIGRNLRRLRERNNLSQLQLADKVGSEAPRISAIENGREGMGKDMMTRLCNVLGVDPYEFYVEDKTPVIIDKEEREAMELFREAEKLGLTGKAESLLRFLIKESKESYGKGKKSAKKRKAG